MIRKHPAASPCCLPTQHATTRPHLPCQRMPRRPGRSRYTRPQTPSAMSSLSTEIQGTARNRRPSVRNDSNRSRHLSVWCSAQSYHVLRSRADSSSTQRRTRRHRSHACLAVQLERSPHHPRAPGDRPPAGSPRTHPPSNGRLSRPDTLGARSGRREEFGEECLDSGLDLVADGSYGVDSLAGGVVELPVEVALAGEVGAFVAAAHGDDDIG
jgi:hypothetical protein